MRGCRVFDGKDEFLFRGTFTVTAGSPAASGCPAEGPWVECESMEIDEGGGFREVPADEDWCKWGLEEDDVWQELFPDADVLAQAGEDEQAAKDEERERKFQERRDT